MTPEEMRRFLHLKVARAGGTRKFSSMMGMNNGQLSRILNGKQPVPASVAAKVGCEKRIVYVILAGEPT